MSSSNKGGWELVTKPGKKKQNQNQPAKFNGKPTAQQVQDLTTRTVFTAGIMTTFSKNSMENDKLKSISSNSNKAKLPPNTTVTQSGASSSASSSSHNAPPNARKILNQILPEEIEKTFLESLSAAEQKRPDLTLVQIGHVINQRFLGAQHDKDIYEDDTLPQSALSSAALKSLHKLANNQLARWDREMQHSFFSAIQEQILRNLDRGISYVGLRLILQQFVRMHSGCLVDPKCQIDEVLRQHKQHSIKFRVCLWPLKQAALHHPEIGFQIWFDKLVPFIRIKSLFDVVLSFGESVIKNLKSPPKASSTTNAPMIYPQQFVPFLDTVFDLSSSNFSSQQQQQRLLTLYHQMKQIAFKNDSATSAFSVSSLSPSYFRSFYTRLFSLITSSSTSSSSFAVSTLNSEFRTELLECLALAVSNDADLCALQWRDLLNSSFRVADQSQMSEQRLYQLETVSLILGHFVSKFRNNFGSSVNVSKQSGGVEFVSLMFDLIHECEAGLNNYQQQQQTKKQKQQQKNHIETTANVKFSAKNKHTSAQTKSDAATLSVYNRVADDARSLVILAKSSPRFSAAARKLQCGSGGDTDSGFFVFIGFNPVAKKCSSSRSLAGRLCGSLCTLLRTLLLWSILVSAVLAYLTVTDRIQPISKASPLANHVRHAKHLLQPYCMRFEAVVSDWWGHATHHYHEYAPDWLKSAVLQAHRYVNTFKAEVWRPKVLPYCATAADRFASFSIDAFNKISEYLSRFDWSGYYALIHQYAKYAIDATSNAVQPVIAQAKALF